MPHIYVCPVCGKNLKSTVKHPSTHAMNNLDWHDFRIRHDFECDTATLLHELYFVQELGTPEICRKFHVNYRVLRDLFKRHKIRMRSIPQAVKIHWRNDDGSRREKAGQKIRESVKTFYANGGVNPSKSKSARINISKAKKKHNPGLIAMHRFKKRQYLSREKRVCKQCGKVFSVPNWNRGAFLCSMQCKRLYHGETTIERMIREELERRNIVFLQEYRVGRFFVDFALPEYDAVIECDGEYWHSQPVAQERDRRKNAEVESHGWAMFLLSETKIHANPSVCLDEILSSLLVTKNQANSRKAA